MTLEPDDALIVVDMQRDFLSGGALAVPNGEAVIPVLNRCLARFSALGLPIFATRDWHPVDHCSFRARGGPWPPHCVAGTAGAEFGPGLALPADARVISKATAAETEAYSGFQGTNLAAQLRALGRKRVWIGGLATDYCVRSTALDALGQGFEVVLIEDAICAVDVHPGDGARALAELVKRGAALVAAKDIDTTFERGHPMMT